jgi:uncharacterized membrane protein
MNIYLLLKTLHVFSAMIVFGTGIGIAWYQLRAWRTKSREHFRWISSETVTADWIFTTSAILLLLASAAAMLTINPFWLQQRWLQIAIALTGLVFLLWLPVVALQYRLRKLVQADEIVESEIRKLMKWWCALGGVAFPLMLAIVFLMVAKPQL